MTDSTLEHKRVLIVGGSSGIGLAVASAAEERGAEVIVASRGAPERIAESAEPLRSAAAYSYDIDAPEASERLFESVGLIDHLVVAVRPAVHSAPFLEIDIEEAKAAFETKFWGQYRLIQAAQRHIRAAGSITLTSGIAGERIYSGASTIAIINGATETLCRTLAVELSPLRVNCVSPGFVAPKPESVQNYARQFPLERLASLEEIASGYLWLMTNPYVTGTTTVLDGGARLV